MAGITDQLRELELSSICDCGIGSKISADARLGYQMAKCCVRTLENRGLLGMKMEKSGFCLTLGCVLWL